MCCHIHCAGDSEASMFHCRVFDQSLSQGSHDYLEG